MVLANPKDDTPLSRRITLDYFLTALGGPELEIKVREREPPDLQAVYKTAIRLETLKKASSSKKAEAATTSKDVIRPSKATRAVQELSDQLKLEAAKEEILKQMSEWKIEEQRGNRRAESGKRAPPPEWSDETERHGGRLGPWLGVGCDPRRRCQTRLLRRHL